METADLENRCNAMRHELKAWEKLFASEHDDRKAGRDDIKANAAISQKYKEYSKLRSLLSGKLAPQTPSKSTRRRKTTGADRTPKARAANSTTTPLKRKLEEEREAAVEEEAMAVLLSPHGPAMIGPTPQRDGIVLGLFDLLPAETPSKRRAVLGNAVPNIIKTPSKSQNKGESEESFESRGRVEKTPMSSSKRFLLDKFVTPRKSKLDYAGTPTSALKGFSTPSFLRRDNVLGAINEEEEASPRPAPWKRRGLGRSLSSMIQSMKQQEEDRLDEEAEIMRELEMEAEGIPIPRIAKAPEILVEDSQAAMPLGPDGAGESDDEDDDETRDGQGRNGKPGKAWKKRGQKRQTRRVIMRPNFVKPPPPTAAQAVESESEAENVPTAIVPSSKNVGSDQEFSEDDEASDYASDHSHTPKQRKTQSKKDEALKDKAAREGPVKTAARKVKATAHANFRRLKIKSSTGAKGGKGRFGRRR